MLHPSALLLCLALAPVQAQARKEAAIEAFKEERERVLIECGQRHLEYGLELRKQGMTLQAATQIVLGVDASRGRNGTAEFILRLMRQFEDAFWKRKLGKPSAEKLAAYERRAAKLRQQDLEELLGLVRFADRKKLAEQAWEELADVLLALDEPLAFDEKGTLLVAGERLDGPLAERARREAVEIGGKPYARDTFLRRVPGVLRLFEVTSPSLRVRSTASPEEAARVHAAASALLPDLCAELGILPERRLQLVVLDRRRDYGAYLDIAGLSDHRAADGFADRAAGTAVLCSEGSTPEYVLGLALHELTHLVQLTASPAAFPSWYLEGSAEAYGGEGTFSFDGTTLTTRGPMSRARLDELRAAPLPLRELLAGDALAFLARDKTAARRFYAQSWAFLRFLETGAGPEIAARLERWRTMCLGSILGADLYKPYAMDRSASTDLFLELFEKDLARLEAEFGVWLEQL
ncbi:MAG TPA: hypothetical protein VF530_00570 [Planctomycetota bacterium]